jgi:hypothetical protein
MFAAFCGILDLWSDGGICFRTAEGTGGIFLMSYYRLKRRNHKKENLYIPTIARHSRKSAQKARITHSTPIKPK